MSVNELRGRRLWREKRTHLAVAMVIVGCSLVVFSGLMLGKREANEYKHWNCDKLMHEKRVLEIQCTGKCSRDSAELLVNVQDTLTDRCDPTGVPQNGKID